RGTMLTGTRGRCADLAQTRSSSFRNGTVLRRLPGGAVHPGDLRCSPGMSRWNTSASSRLEPSMTSIAIIGAGPGLGAAVARRFGTEGFTVGLISRHQGHLDAL